MDKVKALIEWWNRSRVGRMLARYNTARGNQLSGGIAYSAIFSIAAALTLAFSTVMQVLRGNAELYDAVLEALDEALPGIVNTGDNNGLIDPQSLVESPGVNIAGIISMVVLVFSAVSVMTALANSIRAMFDVTAVAGNAVLAKARDLLGFVLLASSVLVTAALGIAASMAGEWIADQFGWDGHGFIQIFSIIGAFLVDTVVFVGLIRVVGGVRPLRRDLWLGGMIGAVGSGALRFLGTSVVGGSLDSDPVLAGFAAIVTLLLWVNLVARLLLFVCAFVANPPSDQEVLQADISRWKQRPNYITLSAPHTLEWDRRTPLEEAAAAQEAAAREASEAAGAAAQEAENHGGDGRIRDSAAQNEQAAQAVQHESDQVSRSSRHPIRRFLAWRSANQERQRAQN